MKKQTTRPGYTIRLSDSFGQVPEAHRFETAFRRWLVGEITGERLTIGQAIERFNMNPGNGRALIKSWLNRYTESHPVPLPPMTESEEAELEAL